MPSGNKQQGKKKTSSGNGVGDRSAGQAQPHGGVRRNPKDAPQHSVPGNKRAADVGNKKPATSSAELLNSKRPCFNPMSSAPENTPLPDSPGSTAGAPHASQFLRTLSATVSFTDVDQAVDAAAWNSTRLSSAMSERSGAASPNHGVSNRCNDTSGTDAGAVKRVVSASPLAEAPSMDIDPSELDGFQPVQTGKRVKNKKTIALDRSWLLIVDDIDRARFPDRRAVLAEAQRIADGVEIPRDRELSAGGWTFWLASQADYDRFCGSAHWGNGAFGAKARAHPPSGAKKDDKPFRSEPKKLRIDDVLKVYSGDDVTAALRKVGLSPLRIVEFKARSPNAPSRPFMVEFATVEQTKAALDKVSLLIGVKRCFFKEMLDFSRSVRLCRRCQRVHEGSGQHCAAELRCPDCSGPHFKGDEQCPVVRAENLLATAPEEERRVAKQEAKRCPNCGGPHSAGYGGCPYMSTETKKSYAAVVAERHAMAKAAEVERVRLAQRRQQSADNQSQPTAAPVSQPRPAAVPQPLATTAAPGEAPTAPAPKSSRRAQKRQKEKDAIDRRLELARKAGYEEAKRELAVSANAPLMECDGDVHAAEQPVKGSVIDAEWNTQKIAEFVGGVCSAAMTAFGIGKSENDPDTCELFVDLILNVFERLIPTDKHRDVRVELRQGALQFAAQHGATSR